MNCKPGDLAFVINEDPGCEANIGKVVKVIGPASHPKYGDWEIQPTSPDFLIYNPRSKQIRRFSEIAWSWIVFPDKDLRPIRPGDISDEEVRDLYAPKLPEVA